MSHSFADTDDSHTTTSSSFSSKPNPLYLNEGTFNDTIQLGALGDNNHMIMNTSNIIDFSNDYGTTSSNESQEPSTGNEIIIHENIRQLLRPAAAEFLGSGLFVFIACGAGMTTINYQTIGATTIGIALTFGFTIFVLAYTIGHISGGHLNFAVTFTFMILRKISILKGILYFLAQW